MKLPNGDRAVVDIEKLRDYCLNSEHPRGKHKARVFAGVLGLSAADADELRVVLLEAARSLEAEATDQDEYGQRFVIDLEVAGPKATGRIRSAWIIRQDEDFARLTTCYVL